MKFPWKKGSLGALIVSALLVSGFTVNGAWNSQAQPAESSAAKAEADNRQPTTESQQAVQQTDNGEPAENSGQQPTQVAPVLASRSGMSEPKASVPPKQTSSTGSGSLTMKATAYGPANINWKYGGKTYTGTTVRQGVIAVDPKVIPLGTRVWVSGYQHPNLPANGFMAVAEDIGGAVRGNRIDIYINADAQSLKNFGVQNVQVRILGK
ncbi:3D domain-containing protein [Effusibacillus consociatus]|uniref:3D domain-containing protein n=1 Tax=Effusibacillus consociatus TaxID=1117041 RepID=A0ABV9PX91_9BACL